MYIFIITNQSLKLKYITLKLSITVVSISKKIFKESIFIIINYSYINLITNPIFVKAITLHL